jgi:hypothetical protein
LRVGLRIAVVVASLLAVLPCVATAAVVRVADPLEKNPLFQTWIRAADERDRQLDAKVRAWIDRARR